jgi:hypothetical protein
VELVSGKSDYDEPNDIIANFNHRMGIPIGIGTEMQRILVPPLKGPYFLY